MRKYLYLFVAAAAMVLAGCQKETEQTINPVNAGKVTVLKASVAENNTKVSADAAGKFAWQAADAITAFDPEGKNLKFTTNAGGSATEFTFDGETALGSYALYPYNKDHMVVDDEILVNLPAEYTYKADETNMPMLGKIENNAASFKAIGGVLKLIVYNIPESASKLTFTAANKQISGAFVIADASEDKPSIATANTSEADEKAVAINFTRSTNMVFYIPLPTGEIDGFTLAFNDSANTSKTVNASFTVGRNKIINAPALNLSPATEKVLWSESFTTELTGTGSGENETVSIANYNNEKNGQTVSSGTVSYSINSNTGTKLYKAGESAKGAVAGELMLSKRANNNNGEFIVTGIPTEGATSATLCFVTNSNAEARATVTSNTEGVTIGKRSVSGSAIPYTITYAIAIESGINSFSITFSNSNSSSNTRIDDISLVATIGAVTITPTIEVGKESETISAGALTASISGVKLVNPIDGTGITVSSAVDWLDAAITEGDYLGAGAKLTATAKSYNHDANARTATVTLKATGVTKTVTFKQNPSLVSSPTSSSFTVTPGDKTFSVSWEGDPKAASYIAYYSTSELEDPTTGNELAVTNEGTTYTAVPKSGAVLTNKTTYNIYVKVATVATDYSEKYGISSVWGTTTATPVGEIDVETVTAPFTSNFKADGIGKFVQDIVTDGGATDDIWTYNSSYGMVATAYINSTRYETEAWLLSPKISIGDMENPYVSFKHYGNYFTNANNMKTDVPIYIREEGGTWTQLNVTYPAGNNFSDVVTVDYSLSAYAGKTVQFGWKYTSSTSRAGTYELDEFKVYAKVGTNYTLVANQKITFSEKGYSNQEVVSSVAGTNWSMSLDKGSNSNAPKYYTSGKAIRAYGGNTFTVTVAENFKITSIKLTFGESDGSNAITSDVGAYSNGTWTGSIENGGSVTFTIGGTSGNRRLAAIEIN